MVKEQEFATVKRYMESSKTVKQAWIADRVRIRFTKKYHGYNYMAMKSDAMLKQLMNLKHVMYKRVMTVDQYENSPMHNGAF